MYKVILVSKRSLCSNCLNFEIVESLTNTHNSVDEAFNEFKPQAELYFNEDDANSGYFDNYMIFVAKNTDCCWEWAAEINFDDDGCFYSYI